MTVAESIVKLSALPQEAVAPVDSDGGLSRVAGLDFVEGQGPGAAAEIILAPSVDE